MAKLVIEMGPTLSKPICINRILASAVLVLICSSVVLACECGNRKVLKFRGFNGHVVSRVGPDSFRSVPNFTFQLAKRVADRLELVTDVTSDQDGRFDIQNISPGTYFIFIDSPGWARTLMEIRILGGKSRSKELEVGLEIAGTCCTGWAQVRKARS